MMLSRLTIESSGKAILLEYIGAAGKGGAPLLSLDGLHHRPATKRNVATLLREQEVRESDNSLFGNVEKRTKKKYVESCALGRIKYRDLLKPSKQTPNKKCDRTITSCQGPGEATESPRTRAYTYTTEQPASLSCLNLFNIAGGKEELL
jgi:hypothetical protein